MALAVALLCSGLAAAEPPSYSEYQVKGAFLYNFAKLVDWKSVPPDSEEFVIAILGEDPFGEALDRTLGGRELAGYPIRVRRINSLAELRDARMLFVSRSESDKLARVLGLLDGRCVLTVGDSPEFARSGGVIELFMRNQSVRFRVNMSAAARAGLKLRPNLLRLAEIVEEDSSRAAPEPESTDD